MGGPGVIKAMTGTIVPNGAFISGWGDASNFGPIGIESIQDGTSNTALFSERLVGINDNPQVSCSSRDGKRGIFNTTIGGDWRSGVAGALQFVQGCKSIPGTQLSGVPGDGYTNRSGYVWLASVSLARRRQRLQPLPAPEQHLAARTPPPSISEAGSPSSAPSGAAPPTSNHPGGVNMGMADGSVKFVKDTTNLQSWWALGTRDSGEVLSSDSY